MFYAGAKPTALRDTYDFAEGDLGIYLDSRLYGAHLSEGRVWGVGCNQCK